jgi:L-lactate permease
LLRSVPGVGAVVTTAGALGAFIARSNTVGNLMLSLFQHAVTARQSGSRHLVGRSSGG